MRGQRSPTVNFCYRLPNPFWPNKGKTENTSDKYFLHLLSYLTPQEGVFVFLEKFPSPPQFTISTNSAAYAPIGDRSLRVELLPLDSTYGNHLMSDFDMPHLMEILQPTKLRI